MIGARRGWNRGIGYTAYVLYPDPLHSLAYERLPTYCWETNFIAYVHFHTFAFIVLRPYRRYTLLSPNRGPVSSVCVSPVGDSGDEGQVAPVSRCRQLRSALENTAQVARSRRQRYNQCR